MEFMPTHFYQYFVDIRFNDLSFFLLTLFFLVCGFTLKYK